MRKRISPNSSAVTGSGSCTTGAAKNRNGTGIQWTEQRHAEFPAYRPKSVFQKRILQDPKVKLLNTFILSKNRQNGSGRNDGKEE